MAEDRHHQQIGQQYRQPHVAGEGCPGGGEFIAGTTDFNIDPGRHAFSLEGINHLILHNFNRRLQRHATRRNHRQSNRALTIDPADGLGVDGLA